MLLPLAGSRLCCRVVAASVLLLARTGSVSLAKRRMWCLGLGAGGLLAWGFWTVPVEGALVGSRDDDVGLGDLQRSSSVPPAL